MTKEAFTYAISQTPVPAGRHLWLYGEPGVARGEAYTPFWDKADALKKKNVKVDEDIADIGRGYDAVFVNCPKNREETEGLIALALERSSGFVMCVAPNDANGNRLGRMCEAYGVEVGRLAKRGCKIVWTTEATKANRTMIKQNLSLLTPRKIEIEGRQWLTTPGLFGWDKIDEGSSLLTGYLPKDASGRVADFGCGYGYLSDYIAQNMPDVTAIDAYDIDARAVSIVAENGGEKVKPLWRDLKTHNPGPVYDMVVMNPPFHNGKQEDIGLGESLIRTAWASLAPGGRLFMVANRNLPYEKVEKLTILHEGELFKVMMGRK